MLKNNFNFGIEAEFPLIDLKGRPLWYEDVPFERLYELLESIDCAEFGTRGLKLESPHRKVLPYVVEGYHLPNPMSNPETILPKGVEIRTPMTSDLDVCINSLGELHKKLNLKLQTVGIQTTTISHHPTADGFRGPMNKRRHDYWQWAMEAMHTYGPDINISVPSEVVIDFEKLHRRVNYYAPALTALTLNSPFLKGKLWMHEASVGKSYRTFRRSVIAPAIELHPDQGGRLEFKPFEMSPYLEDYRGFFLLWLTLLLANELKGEDSDQARIYSLGRVAVDGLASPGIARRANQVIERAHQILPQWGFSVCGLENFENRLFLGKTPANELIEQFLNCGSLNQVLASQSALREAPSHVRTVAKAG